MGLISREPKNKDRDFDKMLVCMEKTSKASRIKKAQLPEEIFRGELSIFRSLVDSVCHILQSCDEKRLTEGILNECSAVDAFKSSLLHYLLYLAVLDKEISEKELRAINTILNTSFTLNEAYEFCRASTFEYPQDIPGLIPLVLLEKLRQKSIEWYDKEFNYVSDMIDIFRDAGAFILRIEREGIPLSQRAKWEECISSMESLAAEIKGVI